MPASTFHNYLPHASKADNSPFHVLLPNKAQNISLQTCSSRTPQVSQLTNCCAQLFCDSILLQDWRLYPPTGPTGSRSILQVSSVWALDMNGTRNTQRSSPSLVIFFCEVDMTAQKLQPQFTSWRELQQFIYLCLFQVLFLLFTCFIYQYCVCEKHLVTHLSKAQQPFTHNVLQASGRQPHGNSRTCCPYQ